VACLYVVGEFSYGEFFFFVFVECSEYLDFCFGAEEGFYVFVE